MKKLLLAPLLLVAVLTTAQQPSSLSYEQHLNYSLGAYLNTPLSHIRVAGSRWQVGDTTAAIQHLQAAMKQGLFDSFLVKNTAQLSGLTRHPAWQTVKAGIEKNLQAMSRPADLKIYSDDVYRFLKLYPQFLKPGGEAIYWKDYITAGTTGLKTFYNMRMSSRPDVVTNTIRKSKAFYSGLGPVASALPSFEKRIAAAADKLETIYPDAIFPPIYFLVGNMNAAGTPDGGAGQLIGLEFFSLYPGRDTSNLSTWFRSVLSDTSRLVGVVVHEMLHIQQKNQSGQSVLAKCLTEGACDFITYLLLNEIIQPRQHVYGNAHEKEIFERFLKEKDGTDLSFWMYNGEIEEKGIPSDLGYYIGFKICEAYYNQQTDKTKAVKDILEIRNYEQLLKESRYSDKFK